MSLYTDTALPSFLQLHDFLNIGKGISDDIARRFPVYALDFTDGTLANVYGSAAPIGDFFFFFCDVMSCLQCAFNVSFDMCHCSPGPCLKRVFWQKPVNGQRGGSCSVSLMKALPVHR